MASLSHTAPLRAMTRRYTRLLPSMHRTLSGRFPDALWSGDPARREVALTFDDGPNPRDTPRLLDLLARHAVRATFFQCGTNLSAAPNFERDLAAAGHQLALHGYYHRPFLSHRSGLLRHELVELQAAIAERARLEPEEICDVRPPFGLFTPQSLRALVAWGFRPVMWKVVPFHWIQPEADTLGELQRGLAPGAIIVLHEGMSAGPDVVQLADSAIRMAKDDGYDFVTASDMWRRLAANQAAPD